MNEPYDGIDMWRIAAGEALQHASAGVEHISALLRPMKSHPHYPAVLGELAKLHTYLNERLEILDPFVLPADGERVPVMSRSLFNRALRAAGRLGLVLCAKTERGVSIPEEVLAEIVSARLDLLDFLTDETLGRIAVLADPVPPEALRADVVAGAYPEDAANGH